MNIGINRINKPVEEYFLTSEDGTRIQLLNKVIARGGSSIVVLGVSERHGLEVLKIYKTGVNSSKVKIKLEADVLSRLSKLGVNVPEPLGFGQISDSSCLPPSYTTYGTSYQSNKLGFLRTKYIENSATIKSLVVTKSFTDLDNNKFYYTLKDVVEIIEAIHEMFELFAAVSQDTHNDLSHNNILIQPLIHVNSVSYKAYLTDFEYANTPKNLEEGQTRINGTPFYISRNRAMMENESSKDYRIAAVIFLKELLTGLIMRARLGYMRTLDEHIPVLDRIADTHLLFTQKDLDGFLARWSLNITNKQNNNSKLYLLQDVNSAINNYVHYGADLSDLLKPFQAFLN